MRKINITIKDIAKLANVSTTTVSRVLNNKPDVKESTKQRILQIIKEYDYYPSALAKGISTNKTYSIGLVIPYENVFANPFFVEVMRGINTAANQAGYFVLLCTPNQKGKDVLTSFKQKRIDGVVLSSPRIDENPIQDFLEHDVPFVSTSKVEGYDNVNYVDVDNYLGAKLAVEHLISLGHKRIGLIGGPSYLMSSHDRRKAFYETLDKNDLKIDKELIIDGIHTYESGYNCMDMLLSVPEPPTAVFVAGDIMAFGAIQYLKRRNIKVPRDMSIIGFDDVPFSSIIEPPLTTIRQSSYEKGYVAANVLLNILNGKSISKFEKLLPVKLIIRHSTAAPKV